MLESEAFKGQKIKVKSGSFKDKRGYIVGLATEFAYVLLEDDTNEKKYISTCLEYEQLEPIGKIVPKHPFLGGLCEINEVTLSAPAHYDEHYASMVGLEPIELMQLVLSYDELIGFLKGNIIKYTLRAGKKQGEAAEKDAAKAKRYIEWLMKFGYKMPINPKED